MVISHRSRESKLKAGTGSRKLLYLELTHLNNQVQPAEIHQGVDSDLSPLCFVRKFEQKWKKVDHVEFI